MAYLCVKKVNGRYYAYRQESYREGSKVKTRTLEYLGAVDPATAALVKSTRDKLGQMDIRATIKDARSMTGDVVTASETFTEPKTAKTEPTLTSPEKTTETAKRYQRMKINGAMSVVDIKTGELLEPKLELITTSKPLEQPTRPFHHALHLPKKLERYGVNQTYIQRKHLKFGNRLKALGINPSHMPDITFKYGHPDSLKRKRDGSFVITISRRTQNKRHPIAKAKMWNHYRQALTTGYLETIRKVEPDKYNAIASSLDQSHQSTKHLILQCYGYMSSPIGKLSLSLQLMFFNRLPKTFHKTDPMRFGQISFNTVNNWQAETIHVLSEVEKSGWSGMEEKTKKTATALKSQITRKRHKIEDLSIKQKLSGKRGKLIREIMALEYQLQAHQSLQSRLSIMKSELEFF